MADLRNATLSAAPTFRQHWERGRGPVCQPAQERGQVSRHTTRVACSVCQARRRLEGAEGAWHKTWPPPVFLWRACLLEGGWSDRNPSKSSPSAARTRRCWVLCGCQAASHTQSDRWGWILGGAAQEHSPHLNYPYSPSEPRVHMTCQSSTWWMARESPVNGAE